MKELIATLNHAAKVYYQGQDEVMTNFEYDKLYDELVALEETTGVVMANSPTVNVGYETLSELPKEAHVAPMLSLEKTKETDELAAWLDEKKGLLSLKLDGLSVILTYENGVLVKALVLTRVHTLPRLITTVSKLAQLSKAVAPIESKALNSNFFKLRQYLKPLVPTEVRFSTFIFSKVLQPLKPAVPVPFIVEGKFTSFNKKH